MRGAGPLKNRQQILLTTTNLFQVKVQFYSSISRQGQCGFVLVFQIVLSKSSKQSIFYFLVSSLIFGRLILMMFCMGRC